jgi:hypothetical protein
MAEGFLVRKGGGAFQFNSPAVIETAAVRYGAATVNAGDFVTVTSNSLTLNSSYQFNTANSTNQNIARQVAVKLSETKQVIFYYDVQYGTIYYEIATIAANKTISYSSRNAISFSIAPYGLYMWDAVMLGNGNIIFSWYESNNHRNFFRIYSFNNTTNTLGQVSEFSTPTNYSYSPSSNYGFSIVPHGQDSILMTYHSYSSAYPVLQLVNLVTQTLGTQLILTSAISYYNHLSKFSDGRYFFVFRGTPQSSSYPAATVVYINNNIITTGNVYSNTNSADYFMKGTPISDTKAVVVWHQSTTPYYTILNCIDASTTLFSGPNTMFMGGSYYPISSNNYNNSVVALLRGPSENQWHYSVGMYNSSSSSNNYHWYYVVDLTSSIYGTSFDSNSQSYQSYRSTSISPINFNNVFITHNNYNNSSGSYNFSFGRVLSNIQKFTVSKSSAKSNIRGVAKTSANPEELIEIYTNAGNP